MQPCDGVIFLLAMVQEQGLFNRTYRSERVQVRQIL